MFNKNAALLSKPLWISDFQNQIFKFIDYTTIYQEGKNLSAYHVSSNRTTAFRINVKWASEWIHFCITFRVTKLQVQRRWSDFNT